MTQVFGYCRCGEYIGRTDYREHVLACPAHESDADDERVGEILAKQAPPREQSGWAATDYCGWWQLVEPDPDREGWTVPTFHGY